MAASHAPRPLTAWRGEGPTARDIAKEGHKPKVPAETGRPCADPREEAPPSVVKVNELIDAGDGRAPLQVRRMAVVGGPAIGGRINAVAGGPRANLGARASVAPPYPLVVIPGLAPLDGVAAPAAFLIGAPAVLLRGP